MSAIRLQPFPSFYSTAALQPGRTALRFNMENEMSGIYAQQAKNMQLAMELGSRLADAENRLQSAPWFLAWAIQWRIQVLTKKLIKLHWSISTQAID